MGQVVGCVALDRAGREPESKLSADAKKNQISSLPGEWGELRRMSVSQRARQRGVASMLHRKLLEHAVKSKLHGVFLSTSSLQPNAVALYQKLGYHKTSDIAVPTLLNRLSFDAVRFFQFELELGEIQ